MVEDNFLQQLDQAFSQISSPSARWVKKRVDDALMHTCRSTRKEVLEVVEAIYQCDWSSKEDREVLDKVISRL